MNGFLKNLAAKGRGAVPRLEPRRPAPYESLPDGPVPDSLEPMPLTIDPLTRPSVSEAAAPSAPAAPAAAAVLPEPAAVISPPPADTTLTSNTLSPHGTAPADTTPTSNTLSPTPEAIAPSATPVAAPSVARRMADAAPNAPPLLAPASLPFTQTPVHRPAAKAVPASSGAIESTAPVPSSENSVLPNIETTRPVIDPPQMPPATETEERSVPTSSTRQNPAPLPLLQGEVQIPRPVTQAAARTPGDAVPTTEAPVVEVHIGTIEVVAAQPQPPTAPQRVEAKPRGISLDDFLDRTVRR